MQSSQNQKIFSDFFFSISEIYIKFGILWNKRRASEVICFWNYRLQIEELLKCPKSYVSEDLWTVNMLKCPKDCLNLLITLKGNQVEKFCFGNILTPNDKYFLSVNASL